MYACICTIHACTHPLLCSSDHVWIALTLIHFPRFFPVHKVKAWPSHFSPTPYFLPNWVISIRSHTSCNLSLFYDKTLPMTPAWLAITLQLLHPTLFPWIATQLVGTVLMIQQEHSKCLWNVVFNFYCRPTTPRLMCSIEHKLWGLWSWLREHSSWGTGDFLEAANSS